MNAWKHIQTAHETAKTLSNFVSTSRGTRVTSQSQLPPDVKGYARFAQAAYKHVSILDGYSLDADLSTDQFKIYTQGSSVIFAIRGSSTEAMVNDFVINDGYGILLGNEHRQLRQARSKFAQIQAKYPNSSKIVTGHSLGAATSAVISYENQIPGYCYNPGSSPFGDILDSAFASPNVKVAVVQGDLVSAAAIDHSRNLFVLDGTGTPLGRHGVDNFVTENVESDHEPTPPSSSNYRFHDIAINEGSLFGGGFHSRYTPGTGELIRLGTQWVPGPGAKVYVDLGQGTMFFFKENGDRVVLPPDGDMSLRYGLLGNAAHYGSGPTVFKDVVSGAQVAFVSHRGQMRPVPANTLEQWRYVLGGANPQHGADGWWAGKRSPQGYVGNGYVNPFRDVFPKTGDDKALKFVAPARDIALFAGFQLLTLGVTAVAPEVGIPLEMAQAAMKSVEVAAMVAQPIPDSVTSFIDDWKHKDYWLYLNSNAQRQVMFKDRTEVDAPLDRDDRIPFEMRAIRRLTQEVRPRMRELTPTQRDAYERLLMFRDDPRLSSHERRDRIVQDLQLLQTLDEGLTAYDTAYALDQRARRFGLQRVTSPALETIQNNFVPHETSQRLNYQKILRDTERNLYGQVGYSRRNADMFFYEEYVKQLGRRVPEELIRAEGQYIDHYMGDWEEYDENWRKQRNAIYVRQNPGNFSLEKTPEDRRVYIHDYLNTPGNEGLRSTVLDPQAALEEKLNRNRTPARTVQNFVSPIENAKQNEEDEDRQVRTQEA